MTLLNGALPPVDLTAGDAGIAVARAISVGGVFTVFGTLLFEAVIAPAAGVGPEGTRDRGLVRGAFAVALCALLLWLVLEAASMASATDPNPAGGAMLAAIPRVAAGRRFGRLVLCQLAALAAAMLSLGDGRHHWRRLAALFAAGLAVLLEAGHGHAVAMFAGPSWLLAAGLIHILAAAAWLGSLPALLMTLRTAPTEAALSACRRYAILGAFGVAGIALSAFYQGWILVGSLAGLVGTAYGWAVGLKTGLFAGLLGLAWRHRSSVVPALALDTPGLARRRLWRSVAAETGLGMLAVLVAATLSGLPPALHTEPVWPFALQPSLVTVREAPEFRRIAIEALLALALALLLVAATLPLRRWRWLGLGAAAVIAWFAVPDLRLLAVEAYPTSFQHSPTGFAVASILEGQRLYPEYCASCHGSSGAGDGPLARSLPLPPANLTEAHLWMHGDGDLIWWLSHGIDAPEGGLAMPGFAGSLDEDQRWALIDFIRARNAGWRQGRDGVWAIPLPAPDFPLSCGAASRRLKDFRGSAVRIVFGDRPPAPLAGSVGGVAIVTVWVPGAKAAGPDADRALCTGDDPAAADAYALVAGLDPRDAGRRLAGAQFLIDPAGWLRAWSMPGAAPDAVDTARLVAETRARIEAICSHPIAAEEMTHVHHPG